MKPWRQKGFVIVSGRQYKAFRNRITGFVFVDFEICRTWDRIARAELFMTPKQTMNYYGALDPLHESLAQFPTKPEQSEIRAFGIFLTILICLVSAFFILLPYIVVFWPVFAILLILSGIGWVMRCLENIFKSP